MLRREQKRPGRDWKNRRREIGKGGAAIVEERAEETGWTGRQTGTSKGGWGDLALVEEDALLAETGEHEEPGSDGSLGSMSTHIYIYWKYIYIYIYEPGWVRIGGLETL